MSKEKAKPGKTKDNDKVVVLDIVTSHDIPVERVLKGIEEAGLTEIVVAGYDKDGYEFFASNLGDGADVIWLLERMKHSVLTIMDKEN